MRRRTEWHHSGGAGYCDGCLRCGRDCGGRCPYVSSQPETVEGWQAWQVGQRSLSFQVIGRTVLPVLDARTALMLAGTLGFDGRAVALLLPAIEAGLTAVTAQAAPDDGSGSPEDLEQ